MPAGSTDSDGIGFGPNGTDIGRQIRQFRQGLIHGKDTAVKDVEQVYDSFGIFCRECLFRYVGAFDNELSLRFHTAIYFSNLSLFFLDSLFNGCFCFSSAVTMTAEA